jgi:hypothetical protein
VQPAWDTAIPPSPLSIDNVGQNGGTQPMDEEDLYDEVTQPMDEDVFHDAVYRAVKDVLAEQRNPIFEAAIYLAFFMVTIYAFDHFSYASWINKFRYSTWYSVEPSQVEQYTKKQKLQVRKAR